MELQSEDKLVQASRLLQLPRELRDLIYEHALVRDTVPIDCAVVEGPGYRKHTGFQCSHSPQLHKAYPLVSPRAHRSTWFLPIYDLKVDIQGGTWLEPKRAQMTYQLAPPCTIPKGAYRYDKISLQLLSVCRKVYSEARKVFYKKNIFSFTGKFPIPTALTFLQDRPATALNLLSSIELGLTEDNNMRGTAEAHFPPTKRSSDCLVLQHAFHFFTDLCSLLSSSAVQLRSLCLTIESLSSYGDSQPKTLEECLAWEMGKSDPEKPSIASWIQPLLQIQNLESIRIYWISDRPRLRRMSNTLSAIQRSMLQCMGSKDYAQINIPRGHELEFDVFKDYGNSFTTTLVSRPQVEYFECAECFCESPPTGLEHIHVDDPRHPRAYYKCGVATWKEHQTCSTGFKSAYTSYCELNSKCSPRVAHRKPCGVHLD